MFSRILLLIPGAYALRWSAVIRDIDPQVSIEMMESEEGLLSKKPESSDLLLSFGTGVIVRPDILLLVGSAYNFHAGSPEYPGRDPHHFAVYDGTRRYGATAHVMTASVDAGPIVGVEWIEVPDDITPTQLLVRANDAALQLMKRILATLLQSREISPLEGVAWSERRTRRRDFIDLCSIPAYIDREEFDRRVSACKAACHDNLTVMLHGRKFRIIADEETRTGQGVRGKNDFTERAYTELLRLAKSRYAFCTYGEALNHQGPHVIWRHDIDMSVHRALRLARIEHEAGVTATYFFMLTSAFYNLHEPDVLDRARAIAAMGHPVGLHFDAREQQAGSSGLSQTAQVQRAGLEELLQVSVQTVSFHNPELTELLALSENEFGGMLNVYGQVFRERYKYCSDSNGYWRYESLWDVLDSGVYEQIHALTHPEWWPPATMSPRERVERCVLGRSAAVMAHYDDCLAKGGRSNIGAG